MSTTDAEKVRLSRILCCVFVVDLTSDRFTFMNAPVILLYNSPTFSPPTSIFTFHAELQEQARLTRCTKVAQEILSTERSYVESLEACINVWQNPLQTLALSDPVLTEEQLTVIFSNLQVCNLTLCA